MCRNKEWPDFNQSHDKKKCQKQESSERIRSLRNSSPCKSPWANAWVSVYTERKKLVGVAWAYTRVDLLTKFCSNWTASKAIHAVSLKKWHLCCGMYQSNRAAIRPTLRQNATQEKEQCLGNVDCKLRSKVPFPPGLREPGPKFLTFQRSLILKVNAAIMQC